MCNKHTAVIVFLLHAHLSLIFKLFVFIHLSSVHFASFYRSFSNHFCCVLNACGTCDFSIFLLCKCEVEKDNGANQLLAAVHPRSKGLKPQMILANTEVLTCGFATKAYPAAFMLLVLSFSAVLNDILAKKRHTVGHQCYHHSINNTREIVLLP